jgi:hypothetical protein
MKRLNSSNKKVTRTAHLRESLIMFTSKVISWLAPSVKLEVTRVMDLVKPFLDRLRLVQDTRGDGELIKYIKLVRTSFFNYLSGSKERPKGIGLTCDGLPKVLGPLIPEIRKADSATNYVPLLITILMCTRSLKTGKKPDTSTITDTRITGVIRGDWTKYRTSFWRTLGYRPSQKVPRSLR